MAQKSGRLTTEPICYSQISCELLLIRPIP